MKKRLAGIMLGLALALSLPMGSALAEAADGPSQASAIGKAGKVGIDHGKAAVKRPFGGTISHQDSFTVNYNGKRFDVPAEIVTFERGDIIYWAKSSDKTLTGRPAWQPVIEIIAPNVPSIDSLSDAKLIKTRAGESFTSANQNWTSITYPYCPNSTSPDGYISASGAFSDKFSAGCSPLRYFWNGVMPSYEKDSDGTITTAYCVDWDGDNVFDQAFLVKIEDGTGYSLETTGGLKAARYAEDGSLHSGYSSLASAVSAMESRESAKLLTNDSGVGFTAEQQTYTVDLNGHTYTFNQPLGEDLSFGIYNAGGNLTITNSSYQAGTLSVAPEADVEMMIYNYGNLNLDKVTIDGENARGTYTLFSRYGDVQISKTTIKSTRGAYAVGAGCVSSYDRGVTSTTDITISEDSEFASAFIYNELDSISGSTITYGNTIKEDRLGEWFPNREKRCLERKGVPASVAPLTFDVAVSEDADIDPKYAEDVAAVANGMRFSGTGLDNAALNAFSEDLTDDMREAYRKEKQTSPDAVFEDSTGLVNAFISPKLSVTVVAVGPDSIEYDITANADVYLTSATSFDKVVLLEDARQQGGVVTVNAVKHSVEGKDLQADGPIQVALSVPNRFIEDNAAAESLCVYHLKSAQDVVDESADQSPDQSSDAKADSSKAQAIGGNAKGDEAAGDPADADIEDADASRSALYVYETTVTKGPGSSVSTISFSNPNGFSRFILRAETADLPVMIGDKLYDSLQDAVDSVEDEGTITIGVPAGSEGGSYTAYVGGFEAPTSKAINVEYGGDANELNAPVYLEAAPGYAVWDLAGDDGRRTFVALVGPSMLDEKGDPISDFDGNPIRYSSLTEALDGIEKDYTIVLNGGDERVVWSGLVHKATKFDIEAANGVKDAKVDVVPVEGLTISNYSDINDDGTGSYIVTGTPYLDNSEFSRLYGETAIDTMQKVVKDSHPRANSRFAVVATTTTYQDALSASGFAGLMNAPIILTDASSLSPVAKETLEYVKSTDGMIVFVIGGPLSISDSVVAAIDAIPSVTAERIYGNAAWDTSLSVYERGKELSETNPFVRPWGENVVISTSNAYEDALSISSYCYAKNMPIILTNDKNVLAQSAIKPVRSFDHVIITGGELSVSDDVTKQFSNEHTRLYGQNAYQTSNAIAAWEVKYGGMTPDRVGIATGRDYHDALVASSHCGQTASPILLVDDGNLTTIAGDQDSFLAKNSGDVNSIRIFGGPLSVTPDVENRVKAAVGF